jgi:hypothetical protein
MNSFEAPHVLRCSRDVHGRFPNEGFDVVSFGIVALEETELKIFEFEDFNSDSESAQPVLSVQFSKITMLHLTKFRSNGGNYRGGLIRIVGVFDRSVEERLTIKMALGEEHSELVALLKSYIGK